MQKNVRKKIRTELGRISVSGNKSAEWSGTLTNIINILYNSSSNGIDWFHNYTTFASEAIQRAIQGDGIKILTPRQIFRTLPAALSQVKVGNTSYNLLNKIRQVIYSF